MMQITVMMVKVQRGDYSPMTSTQVSADDLYGPHTGSWVGHSQAGLSDSGAQAQPPEAEAEAEAGPR